MSTAPASLPTTLGSLRASGQYRPTAIKDELRRNLVRALSAGKSGEDLFPGLVGYGETVIPQVVNAVLAGHDLLLLGLRGQAKTRLARALGAFLDPQVPMLVGDPLRSHPLAPVGAVAEEIVATHGDAAKVAWLSRDERYGEKLATPDVSVADLIGDIDPIRAQREGYDLGDLRAVTFGIVPRTNRGIFAINELPDLAGKVQVGLFNIMQEGDVQIKGFPVRLPLDVMLCFTANPEDYTARGKIITPLKDRIGSEIVTHYPLTVDLGIAITKQEAWTSRESVAITVPGFMSEVVERIAFEAREDKRIDRRSGVSQRMPISVLENVVSNAERRAIQVNEDVAVPRMSDVYSALPAITGKIELEYEGELVGGEKIARELIRRAADATLASIGKDFSSDEIVIWFDEGGALQVGDDVAAVTMVKAFETVPTLLNIVRALRLADAKDAGTTAAACELVLEALVARKKISRSDTGAYGRAVPEKRRRPSDDF